MHLLIQLKNRGAVTDDGKVLNEEGRSERKGTNNERINCTSFHFLLGWIRNVVNHHDVFALNEIARHPGIQEKLRQEINGMFEKHDDQLTYDGIVQLTYMDKVLNETLRKYPPFPMILRKCSRDYTIPVTQITLKKGVHVGIPILGLHNYPQYYPNPEKFDPERFSKENKCSRPAFTWLPFGEETSCVHRSTFCSTTKIPLTLHKKGFIIMAEGGVWLDVEKINNNVK
ncbi:hypothetical protein MTP99_012523 [Tenebrio molitor]|nr:hypothetical protein MTP99_012523 [Tenebrio molitor]